MTRPSVCIGIAALGPNVSELALNVVRGHVEGKFRLPARLLSPLALPEDAFDPSRSQYDAASLLTALDALPRGGCHKVIGVVDVDLCLPIFTYVLGEARMNGRVALVSLYRLREDPAMPEASGEAMLHRAASIALHELGHLFNLLHCHDRQCLMHFAGTVEELDRIPQQMCRYCAAYLADVLRSSRSPG
jgi:archaemetzincin